MSGSLQRVDVGGWAVALVLGIAAGSRPAAVAPESRPLPGTEARAFGNPFGMQLRRPPAEAKTAWAPVIVRPGLNNESCAVVRRDGTIEIYAIATPAGNAARVIRSRDGGLSWSEPETAFPLPGHAYHAIRVLEAADGGLQAVFHIQGEGPGGYRGRLYEVYHTRQPAGGGAWSTPQRIVPGYVGSIRGFTQLAKNGRLLLAVARAVPVRAAAPKTGPDFGWNDTFVYFSDDGGKTWHQSPDELSLALETKNVTRYGAIEPVVLGLRDGRVWMLVRDRGGRLWQSFSPDGERWRPLERSPFISSDSPAELLRLRNGNIILLMNACQNWSDLRSYAMGGREVLQAAISSDEGRSWRGFREILHETNVATAGDRGSAYPSAMETADGKVIVASGQGEGKRAIVLFDPRWLEETEQRDDLAAGPLGWTQYGDRGIHVAALADGTRAVALPLKSAGLCGGAWNFPMADSGELELRIEVPAAVQSLRLSLTDHFNRIDDRAAADHAVFTAPLDLASEPAAGRSYRVRLRWREATRGGVLSAEIDGQSRPPIAAQQPAQFGVNYLRVEFRAIADEGQLLLANLAVGGVR